MSILQQLKQLELNLGPVDDIVPDHSSEPERSGDGPPEGMAVNEVNGKWS